MTDEHHRGSREAEEELREKIEETEPPADDMERRSEELEEEIEQAGKDWERKRDDGDVPGAQPELDEVDTERQDLGEKPGGAGR